MFQVENIQNSIIGCGKMFKLVEAKIKKMSDNVEEELHCTNPSCLLIPDNTRTNRFIISHIQKLSEL